MEEMEASVTCKSQIRVGRDSVLLPFPLDDLLQSWGLREVVFDVFWNVVEGVSKYPMRLGSPICRSSSLELVLQDEGSGASSRRRVGMVPGVLKSGGRGHPSRHSSRKAGRSLVPCSFVVLIAPPCNVSTCSLLVIHVRVAIVDKLGLSSD